MRFDRYVFTIHFQSLIKLALCYLLTIRCFIKRQVCDKFNLFYKS